jgi:demethylmenaquinone methyltransferase / 2-methoxy-6-polyprenyl-1,4-benzoquinol methylase
MTSTIKEPSRFEIWKMFDSISATYDRVNRWMTLGLDLYWRKKVSCFLPNRERISLLDCATGTGDQILSLMENSAKITEAIGVDLAEEMVAIGKEKIQKKPYSQKVRFQVASAMQLPFTEESFDCVTISFGIRNMTDVGLCLKEMHRVLKKGGRVMILESSLPKNPVIKKMHLFYLRNILPKIGGWISNNKDAYRYLNQTIETFPHGESFCSLLKEAGFINCMAHPLTFGTVSIYQGDKI